MTASIKPEVGSAVTTLFNTNANLNALANGSGIVSTTNYDNGSNLYLFGAFEIALTFATSPTANNLINLYLIPALDGTNFADTVDGATPYAPLSSYVGGFQVRAVTTAQRIALGAGGGIPSLVPLPPCLFRPYLINNAGFAFPATVTFKFWPHRYQSV